MNSHLVLAGLFLLPLEIQAASEPEAFPGLPASAYHRIDPTLIRAADPGRITVTAGNRVLEFMLNVSRTHANGDRSYSMSTPRGDGWAHFTQGPNGIFGQIRQGRDHWLLTSDRGGSWLVALPAGGLHYNLCGTRHEWTPTRSDSATKVKSRVWVAPADQPPGTVIDLLIIYNQALGDRYPGALLETRVNHLVDIANQTMGNSELDLGFRLVGLEFFDYRDDNANLDLLNDMASALDGANPAGLEGLGALRDNLGADLVIMLRPHEIELRGNCGIAFFPNNDPALGVNVVSDGMSSWSACLDDVLIHEIGHNLGAGHQLGQGGGAFDPRGAAFVRPGQYNTVMASFGTGRPDRFRGLPVFSSPLVNCGGLPCGADADMDNSAVIGETMSNVASYRPASSGLPLPDALPRSAADTDGDGVDDWTDAFPFDATEQDDDDLDGSGNLSDAFPLDPAEQIDTDDDGIGDNDDDDDDDDGVPDRDDAFPADPGEFTDPDRDGVGSNADDFPNDPGEQRDLDGDGLGDNEDPDDDGDGVAEFDPAAEDILVVSAGNSRILRFDAATGEPRGIEVPPADGLVTFQSDLAWRPSEHTLVYLSDSSIKRLDLLNRKRLGIWVPPYDDDPTAPQLFTGFPTALETIFGGSSVAATRMETAALSLFSGQHRARTNAILNWAVDGGDSPTDLVEFEGGVIVLGQATRTLYRINSQGRFILSGPDARWMKDPRRMALGGDGRLFIADRGRNAVLEVATDSGAFVGEFADLAALGYRRPSSVAVTAAGELLVASEAKNAILAFDVDSGAFLDVRVASRTAGLSQPHAMVVVPALLDRRGDDPRRVIRPNPGLWYNPATNGRGFDIQVFGNRLTAIWYTYHPLGFPIWLFSSGVLDEFEYTGVLLMGSLDDQGLSSFEEVGELKLTFSSERHAEMSFTIGPDAGGEPVQWLAFDHDHATSDHTGLWGRQDGPGWGISLATQGNTHVAIAFIYDTEGRPSWLISDPVKGDAPLRFTMNGTFSTTLCPSCSGEPEFDIGAAGTMEIQPGPNGFWSSDIQLPSPPPPAIPEFPAVDWVLDEVPIVLFSDPPEAPR